MKSLFQPISMLMSNLIDRLFARRLQPNGSRAWLVKTRRGDYGYLRILAILRVFAYIGAGITLYLPTTEAHPLPYSALPFAVAGVVFSSIVWYFSVRQWPLFVSRLSKQIQVFADLIFISALWALSNKLRSDLFLLYLMPIFVSIEFLSPLYAILALCTSWLGAVLAFRFISETLIGADVAAAPWILSSRLAVLSGFSLVYLLYQKYQTTSQSDPEKLRKQIGNEIKKSPLPPTQRRTLQVLIDDYAKEAERQARLRGYLADQNISAVMDAAMAALEYNSQPSLVRELMSLIAQVLECNAGTFRILGKDANGKNSLILIQAIGEVEPASNEIRYLDLDVEKSTLVSKAFLTKRTVACHDIITPEQRMVHYTSVLSDRYHLRSAISTPFTFGNVQGVVTMYRHRVQAFTTDEKHLFEILARYLALLFIRNERKKQAETRSEQREKRVQLLRSLAQLAHFDKEEEILQFAVDKILKDLNAEGSAVFLIRGSKLKRKAVAGIGSTIPHVGDWFRTDEGINGEVFRTGKYIVRNDAMTNREYLKPESFETYCRLSRFERIEHVFVMPLEGKFGRFGVLRVSNKLTSEGDLSASGFSDEDVEVMLTVASTVSIALDRLQQVIRSALLFDISNFINTTRNQRIALNYIVDKARHLINADECGIALFDEEERVGHVVADSRDSAIEEHHLLLSLDGNESIEELRRTHEPISIVDAQNDPRMQRVAERMTERKIKSILLVPILIDGKLVGSLGLDSVAEEREFTTHEKELCKVVASLCAALLAQSEFIEEISNDAIKRERQRLYGSLHDTKGTIHAGVMLPLEVIQYLLQNKQITESLNQIDQVWRCGRFVYEQINWLMTDSADPVLATEGLPAAIERFGYMLAPGRVIVDCDQLEDIDFQDSVTIYRIAQEAIANAVKHNKVGNNLCSVRIVTPIVKTEKCLE